MARPPRDILNILRPTTQPSTPRQDDNEDNDMGEFGGDPGGFGSDQGGYHSDDEGDFQGDRGAAVTEISESDSSDEHDDRDDF